MADEQAIGHVVDWLTVAIGARAEWLANVDELGRPKKLMKFGSIEAIVKEADKAMRLDIERGSRAALASGDERIVITLSGGMSIVEMLSKEALDRESSIMQHCVGNGGYDKYIGSGDVTFYSLRDASGRPHATLQVDLRDRAIIQTRGKQNAVPVEKYMAALMEAVVVTKLQIEDVDFVIDRTDNIRQKASLPDVLSVYGSLVLSDQFSRGPLPNVVSVELDLSLNGRDDITELPTILSVGRSIFASGTGIKDWRPLTMLPGHLILSGSPVEHLADKLAVNGDLDLRGTRLTKLPQELCVAGDLELHDTAIRVLPEGLYVGRTLTLGNAPVESISAGTEVGTLDLRGSSLKELPAGLIINNDLILSEPLLGGKLRSISPNVELRGEVKVTKARTGGLRGFDKGPNTYKGHFCKSYTLEEIRGYLTSDFMDLPF
ncbi:PcfJ domain-containing protein [Rhizobium sp. BK176]|uniref:PcfJ domain-containing protein n=1 Tax=Rhizobium sp. BK176 TaxID=2587071 RepID=UPI00216A90DB|nr:PcfJ domain-containing protein [Rhizobium sp. BK176]MCS4089284.1 hypothetical protein [Rhizobium sp. BK176]